MINGRVILDASALTALLLGEAGHELVAGVAAKSIMSAVNVAEVAKILIDRKLMPENEIILAIEGLIEEIIPFTARDACINAHLSTKTKNFGLSFGDRACIALGITTGCTVYTSNKDWSKLGGGCKIVQIR